MTALLNDISLKNVEDTGVWFRLLIISSREKMNDANGHLKITAFFSSTPRVHAIKFISRRNVYEETEFNRLKTLRGLKDIRTQRKISVTIRDPI